MFVPVVNNRWGALLPLDYKTLHLTNHACGHIYTWHVISLAITSVSDNTKPNVIFVLQLRGRSGRQGDPGSTRYFLSLEDNLFRIFGGDKIQGMMAAFQIDDLPIESKMLTNALDEAQRKVESYFYDIRKQLFEYDQVLNTQRDRVYYDRRAALEAKDLSPLMVEYAEKTVDDILEANIP